MSDKFRVEARNTADDKEYVNAIECDTEDDANTLAGEWGSRFGNVKVVKPSSGEKKSDASQPKKSAAKKSTAKKSNTGQSGTGSNTQKEAKK